MSEEIDPLTEAENELGHAVKLLKDKIEEIQSLSSASQSLSDVKDSNITLANQFTESLTAIQSVTENLRASADLLAQMEVQKLSEDLTKIISDIEGMNSQVTSIKNEITSQMESTKASIITEMAESKKTLNSSITNISTTLDEVISELKRELTELIEEKTKENLESTLEHIEHLKALSAAQFKFLRGLILVLAGGAFSFLIYLLN
jgi:ABC-type transporter Mla subunit MlaD